MALLHRIAISHGDKWRKDEATKALITLELNTVMEWNQRLQTAIYHKLVEGILTGPAQTLGLTSEVSKTSEVSLGN
jgi:hypothetical protein